MALNDFARSARALEVATILFFLAASLIGIQEIH